MLEEVVQDHFRDLPAPELDHQAHAVLVGLVAHLADPFELLVLDELGDAFLELGLVDLVGELGDHDAFPLVLERGPGAEVDAPPAARIGLADPGDAVDDPGGREIGTGDELAEIRHRQLGPLDQRQAGVDDLAQVVRGDVGGHPDGDPGRAVDQQVGDARRQDRGLGLRAVVVGDEIDRLLIEIGQQFVGDARHAHLGVAHGRRGIAVHRAEIALPIDEHVAQRKGLRHAHDGVVDGHVAVGVVFTDDVADHARRFLVGLVPVVAELAHRVQDAPVYGLEPVAGVGQGASHDDAHGVVQIGLAHLVFDVDGGQIFGEIDHGPIQSIERL